MNSSAASKDAAAFKKGGEAEMELWKLLGWYFSFVRHSLTHKRSEWQVGTGARLEHESIYRARWVRGLAFFV
jgi:hypothetical protein